MSEEQYRAFFNDADVDGSGCLTAEELITALKKRGYTGGDGLLKDMFEKADSSGDDKVTMEEYLSAMCEQPQPVHKSAAMRRVFMDFDADGSGQIDRSELAAVFAEMGKEFPPEQLKRMIELADEDSSGTLNYDEFIHKVFGQ